MVTTVHVVGRNAGKPFARGEKLFFVNIMCFFSQLRETVALLCGKWNSRKAMDPWSLTAVYICWVCRMMEEKYFKAHAFLFSFVAASTDRAIGTGESAPMTSEQTTHAERADSLMKDSRANKIIVEVLEPFEKDPARL